MDSHISERNIQIDMLRAIGMICVIMGHTGSVFANYIYTFHMGLFFFVTGYLSYRGGVRRAKYVISKKVRTLLIPYFIFWIFSMFVAEMQSYFGTHQFFIINMNNLLGLILGGHWLADYSINFSLWYFQLCFIASIIFEVIIRRFSEKMKCLLFLFFILITLPFQTFIPGRPAFHINVLPSALVFMLMGYWFYFFEKKYDYNNKILISVSLLIIGWRISTTHYGNIAGIESNIYYIGAFCTICGLYYYTYNIKWKIIKNFLQYVGRKTVWILGLHSLLIPSAFGFVSYMLDGAGIKNMFLINMCGVWCTIILCCGVGEFCTFLISYGISKVDKLKIKKYGIR